MSTVGSCITIEFSRKKSALFLLLRFALFLALNLALSFFKNLFCDGSSGWVMMSPADTSDVARQQVLL